MLTIYGRRSYGGFCDRVARRDFLKIGGMALGGLALPQLLRVEAAQGSFESLRVGHGEVAHLTLLVSMATFLH